METKVNANPSTEEWIIYIDETYIEPEHRLVTAFWAVNKAKEEKVFLKYHDLVYKTGTVLEAKSTSISDSLNVKALETTKGYRAKCVISDLNLSEINKEAQAIDLTINVYAYLMPIKLILKQIKQVTKFENVLVQIVIDNLSTFHPGSQFDLYSDYFLNLIKSDSNSKSVDFNLNWSMADSKKNIGIQIADLICGAYRKEIKYRKFQPDIKLIPFKYLKFHENEKILENRDFLQIYALINLLPPIQPQKVEDETISEEKVVTIPNLHVLHDFSKLKEYINEMDSVLNNCLNYPNEIKILVCDILHQYFNQIFIDTNRFLAIKQKYTTKKECNSIINNFRKNLVTLKRMINKDQISDGQDTSNTLKTCIEELKGV